MSSGPTAGTIDALDTVRDAVAIVCEVDPSTLAATTRFDDLGADSLSRVSIADVIEGSVAAQTGQACHIDDALLGRMVTLADLAEHLGR
jgi:acyl carrier protein